jgi:SAM-dependent methyltransferase
LSKRARVAGHRRRPAVTAFSSLRKGSSLHLTSRLFPLRTLPFRAADLLGTRASRFGERRGWDWLVYNPVTMWSYQRLARADAGTVMAAMASVFPDARRYVDVGAGSGAFAAAGQRRGLSVLALERSRAGRAIGSLQRVRTAPFDLRRAEASTRQFDLAYCFEVAEHLDPQLGDRLVTFLAGAASVVVFTAARPGQGGYGHINEQPPAYWRDRFEAAGMDEWQDATENVKQAFAQAGVRAPWFFTNAMVFRRREQTRATRTG